MAELQKVNDEYTKSAWRMSSPEWHGEPYKSIRERLFAVRKELIKRWQMEE